MNPVAVPLALAAAAALGLLAFAYLTRGSPHRLGRIVYQDEGERTPTLYDHEHHVRGKPDAILLTGRLPWTREHRPLEYKSTPAPPRPYAGHALQLMAHGLLVQARYGRYPRCGYLQYADQPPIKIDLGPRARAYVLDAIRLLQSGTAHPRSVPTNARCRNCATRSLCRFQPPQKPWN